MNPKDAIGRLKQPILSVIPPASLIHEARAMAFGAFKAGKDGTGYGPFNWRDQPVTLSIYLDAIERHLLSFIDGEDVAPDSLVHHLAHVKAGCGIILDAMENGSLIDDRPKVKGEAVRLLREATEAVAVERPERGIQRIPREEGTRTHRACPASVGGASDDPPADLAYNENTPVTIDEALKGFHRSVCRPCRVGGFNSCGRFN